MTNTTDVTKEGLEHVRPGREAQTWSGLPPRNGHGPVEHRGGSYYGEPIINPPVWEELDIAGYLFTGGLAGASSLLGAGADLTGRPALARTSKLCATAAIGTSLGALIHDLGRPERFINMLRVFKPTSPMSVGTWILAAYTPLNLVSTASSILGRAPRTGTAAGVGAAALGTAVSTYTAALIASTSVPAWREARRELPFLFAGSAATAAAGAGLLGAPVGETGPAVRMALLGAAGELVTEQLMEHRLGMISETLHEGKAETRLRAAKALTAGGALTAATLGRRNRLAAALSGAALVAGSALTRFGLFDAGMRSARDPKYTVVPQRERLSSGAQQQR